MWLERNEIFNRGVKTSLMDVYSCMLRRYQGACVNVLDQGWACWGYHRDEMNILVYIQIGTSLHIHTHLIRDIFPLSLLLLWRFLLFPYWHSISSIHLLNSPFSLSVFIWHLNPFFPILAPHSPLPLPLITFLHSPSPSFFSSSSLLSLFPLFTPHDPSPSSVFSLLPTPFHLLLSPSLFIIPLPFPLLAISPPPPFPISSIFPTPPPSLHLPP